MDSKGYDAFMLYEFISTPSDWELKFAGRVMDVVKASLENSGQVVLLDEWIKEIGGSILWIMVYIEKLGYKITSFARLPMSSPSYHIFRVEKVYSNPMEKLQAGLWKKD